MAKSSFKKMQKNTKYRLVYLLARVTFLIEDLKTMYPLPHTTASENLLKSLIKRREEVPTDFYGTAAMIDRVWTMYPLPNTTASENLLKSLIKRREEVPTDFYGTGAMIDRNWTTANFEMRQSLTRLAVHGFHHVICNNPSFHEPSDS